MFWCRGFNSGQKLEMRFLYLSCCAILIFISLVESRRVIRAAPGEETTGNYIVVMEKETNHSTFEHIADEVRNESIDHRIAEKVEGPFAKIIAAKMTEEGAHRLKNQDGVAFVEEETFAHGSHVSWAVDRIDQASSVIDGEPFTPCHCGEGVDIYILDSGVNYDHCEFGGRAKYPGYDPVDNYLSTNNQGRDCHGHGTHVASLAIGKNYGVARCANVYSVRVLRCDNGAPWSVVIDGLNYAARKITEKSPRRPSIINLSLGGAYHESVDQLITSIINQGITVSVAAGNDRRNACSSSPASNSAAITVAGFKNGDEVYYYTNAGPCIDIFAPGQSVEGASHSCTTCLCSKTLSGTSMSTPMVSGAAALLLEENPGLSPARISQKLKQDCLKNVIDFTDLLSEYRSNTNNCLLRVKSCNNTCNGSAVTSTTTSVSLSTTTLISIIPTTTTRTTVLTQTQVQPVTVTETTSLTVTITETPLVLTPTSLCCETLRNFQELQKSLMSDVGAIVRSGLNDISLIVRGENLTEPEPSSCEKDPLESVIPRPIDTPLACEDLLKHTLKSGLYQLQINDESKTVYCELEKEIKSNRGFMRIANVNMSDPNTDCPDGLSLRTDGNLRTCQRNELGKGCSSAYFNTSGFEYSRVCGRVRGYQWSSPNAFYWFQRNKLLTVNDLYVDGVVLTNQVNESRSHIWTFAAAIDEVGRSSAAFDCQCTNKDVIVNFETPSYVGNDYFCETGSRNFFQYNTFYTEDPLWDGKGCGEVSACCDKGEWFCKDVPKTSSDIELRLCGNEERLNEDTPLDLIELYVK